MVAKLSNVYVQANNHTFSNSKPTKNQAENVQKISRVDEIKKDLQNGTYELDMQATAKKIAETLIVK